MKVYRKLIENFLSLSSIQILNYILPLITLPYLVRVLGPHNYGLVMFAQAVVQYFVLLTGYGFNLSAPTQIARQNHKSREISEILSAVLTAKLFLSILSLAALFVLVLVISPLRLHWVLYAASFGYILSDLAFPVWLFQGLEDMKFITLANVISKVISTILIVTLIHHPGNYLIYPVVMGLSNILGGIFSFTLVIRKYSLSIGRSSVQAVRHQLNEGWLIFISTVSVNLYTTSNPVILGMFTTPTIVGYYVAAEKLITACQGMLIVVSQTIYPHVARLIHESIVNGLRFLHQVTLVLAPLTLGISVAIFFLSHPVVIWLFGSKYVDSILILRVLSVLPFMISLSNIFGIQTMLPLNLKRAFMTSTLIGAFTNIALSFILVPFFASIGTAICVTVSETVITLTMYLFLLLKGINVLTGKVKYQNI